MKRSILLILTSLSLISWAFAADLPVKPRDAKSTRAAAPHNPNEEADSDSYLEPMTHDKNPCTAAFMGGDDESASGMYDDARGGGDYSGI